MSPPSFAEYSEAQVEALPSVSSDLGSLPQLIFEVIFIRWIGIISCLLPQPHLKKWNIFIFFAIINVGCLPDMSSEQTVVVIVTIAVAIWIVLLVWNMLVSFIVVQNEGCVSCWEGQLILEATTKCLYKVNFKSYCWYFVKQWQAIIELLTVSCDPLWLYVYILSWYLLKSVAWQKM